MAEVLRFLTRKEKQGQALRRQSSEDQKGNIIFLEEAVRNRKADRLKGALA